MMFDDTHKPQPDTTAGQPEMKPFSLGAVVATPGAIAALEAAGQTDGSLLERHRHGDWGDLPDEDRLQNDRALVEGTRLFSAYELPTTGQTLWVITEADRSVTTLLLAEEY